MIDELTLKQFAKEKEIDEFTVLREYLQVSFLESFYSQPSLKRTYFKGGTALRLLFGSNRFSEDLDFTTSLNKTKIKKTLDICVTKLSEEFLGLSWKELKTLLGWSAKLYLPVSFAPQPLTVKLDFSMREIVSEPMANILKTDLPVATIALIEHLSSEEILAEKIRAMTKRIKGRDLFDLWFLLNKKIAIKKDLVQKKFVYYKEEFVFGDLIKVVENWPEKELDQDLRCFLPLNQRQIIGQLKRLVAQELKTVILRP